MVNPAAGPALPVILLGVPRTDERVATYDSDGGAPRRLFLRRQCQRLCERVRRITDDVDVMMDDMARQAADQIFAASYSCPHHEQRSGPSEGPEACRICHPVTPLYPGLETFTELYQSALDSLTQAHLADKIAEMVEFYPPPVVAEDSLVAIRWDWAGPGRGLVPPPEEVSPPSSPPLSPVASPVRRESP